MVDITLVQTTASVVVILCMALIFMLIIAGIFDLYDEHIAIGRLTKTHRYCSY